MLTFRLIVFFRFAIIGVVASGHALQIVYYRVWADGKDSKWLDNIIEFDWFEGNECRPSTSQVGLYTKYTGSSDFQDNAEYFRRTYSSSTCSGNPLSSVKFDTSIDRQWNLRLYRKNFWYDVTNVYDYEYKRGHPKDGYGLKFPPGVWLTTSYHRDEFCKDSPSQVHAIIMGVDICTSSYIDGQLVYKEQQYRINDMGLGPSHVTLLTSSGERSECRVKEKKKTQNEVLLYEIPNKPRCIPAFGGFYTKRYVNYVNGPEELRLEEGSSSIPRCNLCLVIALTTIYNLLCA